MPGKWALLLIDVDNLKAINDTFGHAAGDDLISVVAARLSDAVSPTAAYRLGGDEFAVIIGQASRLDVEMIAAKILTAVNQPAICCGHAAFPSVTIGAALSSDMPSVAEIRHQADIALYHSKETARGGYTIYDRAMASAIMKRSIAIQTVAKALQENRIEAWYQPLVRIDTGEIVGVEALARMRELDGTIVSAAAFHEATKDAQVAASLTRQMIRLIARDVGHWLRLGIPFQHVGINLSAADFSCSDLPGSLEVVFSEEGVPLRHAILEVTESVYLGSKDQKIARKIAELRAGGLKVALDDFGTGFASLTHLLTMPVDIIKIDKSFVARLAPDDAGTGIVEGILHIAKRLGIRVVAEGIETITQAEMLVERGCLLGQGYLYSRALPADGMRELLQLRAQRPQNPEPGTDTSIRRKS